MQRCISTCILTLALAWCGPLAPAQAVAQDLAPPPVEDVGDGALEHGAAAGEHHEEVGAMPTVKQGLVAGITSVVVFLIVLAILSKTAWPKIVKGLDDRAQKIREEITAAEEARHQSKQALEQYERAISEAEAEARRILDQTKAEQQKISAELKAKADAELASMKERARADIESAKKSAVTELYAEAANLATLVASRILKRELNDEDRRRLLDDSLRELESIES